MSAPWKELRSIDTLKPKISEATLFFSPDVLNEHFTAVVNRHTLPPLLIKLDNLQLILLDLTFQPTPQLNFAFQAATIK